MPLQNFLFGFNCTEISFTVIEAEKIRVFSLIDYRVLNFFFFQTCLKRWVDSGPLDHSGFTTILQFMSLNVCKKLNKKLRKQGTILFEIFSVCKQNLVNN